MIWRCFWESLPVIYKGCDVIQFKYNALKLFEILILLMFQRHGKYYNGKNNYITGINMLANVHPQNLSSASIWVEFSGLRKFK